VNENLKRAGLFTGITFLLSWLLVALFLLSGGRWNTPEAYIVAVAFMFVPMIVALVLQGVVYKEPLKEPLGISFRLNWWFLVAWLLPPVIALATIGVSLLFPGVDYSPDMAGFFEKFSLVYPPEQIEQMKAQAKTLPVHPFWLGLLQGLVAGITVNAVAGFGEELGWRGFLQKELGYLGFWKSSAVIGLIWGIWHTPFIFQGHNYPQHPKLGVLMMIIWCLLLAPIFSYIRLKSNSVIAAAILHGSLNATAGLALMVVEGGSDLTVGVTGLAGFLVLFLLNLLLAGYAHFRIRRA